MQGLCKGISPQIWLYMAIHVLLPKCKGIPLSFSIFKTPVLATYNLTGLVSSGKSAENLGFYMVCYVMKHWVPENKPANQFWERYYHLTAHRAGDLST